MSKVFKTIGIIAGAVALVATGVGAIAGGAIAGASLSSIGAIAGVVSTAASIGSQLTAKPPNARGSVNGLLIGSNLPTPYLMGECYSGGVLQHDTGYGGTVDKVVNPYRFMVVVHSGVGPVQGHVQSYADFSAISFSGTAATGHYSTFLYRSLQLGTRPESAALSPHFSGAPGWGSDYKLSGYAATAYSLKFDKTGKRFASGVPQLGEVWQGVKVYDPRLDSTYPGGSGSQRITDESTWTYSTRPALHALAYAYGRYVNGVKVFGADLGGAAIDLPAFVAWANVCDANDWEVAGTIYEPGDKWQNLKRICEAGAAEPVFKGGLLTVKYAAPRIALDVITGADLADGDISFRGARPWKERLNGVIPKYRSAAHQWNYVQSALVQDEDALAEDGEDKIEERQFDLVKSEDQAAQLAGYLVADSREAGPLVIPCKPRLMEYRIGDALTIDLPDVLLDDLNGGNFTITGRSVDPGTGIVTLTLFSDASAKHGVALGQTGTLPATKSIATPAERDGAIIPVATLISSNLVLRADGTLTLVIDGDTTVLGRVTLPDLGAASDTARRQLEDDLAKLSEAVAQLATGQQIVQNVFRDAGLYTDPASGTLKLFAIERRTDQTSQLSIDLNAALAEIGLKASVNYVNEAILAAELGGAEADLGPLLVRLTSAEASIDGLEASVVLKADATTVSTLSGTVSAVQSTLDALAATVATKASQTVVDGQGARLTLAEATLAAFDGASISQSVTASRQVPAASDISGENNILALLGSVQANELVETGIARARTELTARVATATDAIAALETTLGVQIGQVTAQIGAVQSASIAGDLANAASLATFQAAVNGSLATVNTAISAQATSISAVATSVSSLTTTVNGNTASITSFATSISGLQARGGLVFNLNGRISGVTIDANSSSTKAIFQTDSVEFVSPSGERFFYADETGKVILRNVEVDTLKAGSVDSPSLAAGAIQKTYFRKVTGAFTVGPKVGDVSSGLTLFNVGITKADASSIIEVIMYATLRSIDDLKFSTAVQIDGTTEQTGGGNLVFDGGASAARVPLTMVAFKEGLSAGAHTISVSVFNDSQDNLTIESLATLRITELRQAAI